MENNMIDEIIKKLEVQRDLTLDTMSQEKADEILFNDCNNEEFDAGYNQGLNQAIITIKQIKGDNNENL